MTTLKSVLEEEAAGTSWRRRFWEQGAQPTMVISRPETAPDWDDGARDRFIESLRAAASRGKPLLLEEGMTSNPAASFNPKSTEYLGTKKFTREEVLRMYNLPVGLFEQGSASNIGQFRAMLYSETLAPMIAKFVDELETQLLTDWWDDPYDEDMRLEPAVDDRLKADIMSQIDTLVRATGGPIATRKEARDYLGWKTLPDDQHADVLILPVADQLATAGETEPPSQLKPEPGSIAAQQPVRRTEQLGAGTGNPVGAPPSGNVDKPTADSRDQSQNQKPTAAGGAKPASAPKRAPGMKTAAQDRKVHDQFVREVAKDLTKFAERQKAAVLSKKGANVKAQFDSARWNKELTDVLRRHKRRITNYYGTKQAENIGGEWDEGRTHRYIDDGAEAQAKNLNDHTAAFVHGDVTATELGGYFDRLASARMPAVASDVVTAAKSFATVEAVVQAGKAATKTWNTLSGNPRPSHDALDGETVKLDETFSNGLRYPHDPQGDISETAGCTCELTVDVSNTTEGEAA